MIYNSARMLDIISFSRFKIHTFGCAALKSKIWFVYVFVVLGVLSEMLKKWQPPHHPQAKRRSPS